MGYFSDAHTIMAEFVESPSEVEFRDDDDWSKMPEVAAAIRACGAEESSFCVAIDPQKRAFGIGIGAGWKGRQPAAKLALGLAMARLSGQLERVSATYPLFGKMCAGNGLLGGMGGDPKRAR